MKAKDLAIKLPPVRVGDPVSRAVKIMVNEGLPGLVVTDWDDKPRYVLADAQVLRLMVSQYLDDSALARTIDEASADQFWSDMGTRSLGECLEPDEPKFTKVRTDATVLDVVIAMSKSRTPLIAVVDETGKLTGCITLNGLLAAVALPYV
ncbi:CBS domain-containing protein [Propionimicrobium sp. PCR01-08-3]|uniref:CBS domain-containing protein n=1 Tax=Propionimicrobium sp. PCR01-08-3 TaxID=3052086 RepID=UPI00255C3DA1|nr:CBS domain-containing protein [Propionimicrobium sp. PCR01-08-3]WIY82192.1 CBS domain-containing protein [Propionimicrobium sp. PCR01-08-3]